MRVVGQIHRVLTVTLVLAGCIVAVVMLNLVRG